MKTKPTHGGKESVEEILDAAVKEEPVRTEKLEVPEITRDLRRSMTGNTIQVLQALKDGAVTAAQVAAKMGISAQSLQNKMNSISAAEKKFLTEVGFKG